MGVDVRDESGRRRLAAVLASVTDAVLVMDRDRNLRLVNSRARQLLGYEPGDPRPGGTDA